MVKEYILAWSRYLSWVKNHSWPSRPTAGTTGKSCGARATRRGPLVVGEDAMLFRLLHDDGDEEDLEETEAAEALGLYATGDRKSVV